MVVMLGGLGKTKHETRAGFGLVTKNRENSTSGFLSEV